MKKFSAWDIPEKVRCTAKFGIDCVLRGMKYGNGVKLLRFFGS